MPLSDRNLWKPAIYVDATLRRLPRPVGSLSIIDGWRFNESEVPLKDGATISGHSYKAPRIRVSGQMAIDDTGSTKLTEIGMFDAWSTFRGYMNLDSTEAGYEFFVYHDTGGGGTYRKFKDVWPVSMNMDLGDDNNAVFTWSAEWVIEDHVIYTTAPGA